jgi:RimJ/RimL family protein N-acetyltransferase
MILVTDRLVLRGWQESDRLPWAQLNADLEVRRFLGPVLSPAQSEAWAINYQDDLDRHGFGFWALEVRDSSDFVGFCGLSRLDHGSPVCGVEVGWRLARLAWGHGYATEAGRAVLSYGLLTLGLPEVLAVTAESNTRARALARRLGMKRDPGDDFDDPDVPDPWLRRYVVYRAVGRELTAVS